MSNTLSKQALKCMYTATAVGSVVGLAVIIIAELLLLIPQQLIAGQIAGWILGGVLVFNMLLSPYFRYHRYRYHIDDECIDIIEGYLWVKHHVVPIERLHKLQTEKGPIDQMFKVAKVKVTTAGGDVTIRFLDEEIAERIAESLKDRVNEIVVEQRQSHE